MVSSTCFLIAHDKFLKTVANRFEHGILRIVDSKRRNNMVRIITGTIVECGMGKIEPCEIPDIIKSGDRRKSGLTAPPEGLFLKEVYY